MRDDNDSLTADLFTDTTHQAHETGPQDVTPLQTEQTYSITPDARTAQNSAKGDELQQRARQHAELVAKTHSVYKLINLHTHRLADGTVSHWVMRLKNGKGEKRLLPFAPLAHFTSDRLAELQAEQAEKLNKTPRAKSFICADGFINREPCYKLVYPAGNGKKPLYALDRISTAPAGQPVWFLEGQQKADAINQMGGYATTGGACSSISNLDLSPLAGRHVIIWPDHDAAGHKMAHELAPLLHAMGCTVEMIDTDLLELPEAGDIVDWISAQNKKGLNTTLDDIQTLQRNAYTPKPENATASGSSDDDSKAAGYIPDEVLAERIAEALGEIETALALANDPANPDPAAIWDDDVLQALTYIRGESKKEWASIRYKLKCCKAIKLSEIEAAISGQDQQEQFEGISDSAALIELALKSTTLCHDSDGEPYAILTISHAQPVAIMATHAPPPPPTVRQCWHVKSANFQEWLSYSFYQEYEIAPSETAMRSATAALTGRAKFAGDLIEVHTRTAKLDGIYYLDLCNDLWQAVAISATGWQVITEPPVYFTRSKSMRPLPTPIAGTGDISQLWEFANVMEQDRGFVLAWLLECLRPETPYPVLEICGEQGSAKSSTQARLRQLIDPNKSDLRAAPKNKDDVFVSAKNSLMVSYENLSYLSPEYQDALCTLATGGGYAGRTLYTNTDESVVELKRPIALNGISVIVTAQDLLDRTIHIDAPVLNTTMTETQLDEAWQQHYSAMFTGLLDLFSQTLASLPRVKLEGVKLPRMADFTLLGEALYISHNVEAGTFHADYVLRRSEGVSRTVDSSPIAVAMMEYLKHNPRGYSGTVKGLLESLEQYKESSDGWVKSPKGLGDQIQRLSPAFRQIGIILAKSRTRTRDGYLCELKYDPAYIPPARNNLLPSTPSTQVHAQVHQISNSGEKIVKSVNIGARCEHGEPEYKSISPERYIRPSELDAPVSEGYL